MRPLTLRYTLEPGAIAPERKHEDDAGLDLATPDPITIQPHTMKKIDTGVKVAIPTGHVGMVFVRSSIGIKRGCTLANGTGIIDSGYRGNIICALVNHTDEPVNFIAGERIAQLLIMPLTPLRTAETTPQFLDMLDGDTSDIATGMGLKAIRNERKTTQKELADYLNTSQAQISNWEHGNAPVTEHMWPAIEVALNTTRTVVEETGATIYTNTNTATSASGRGAAGIGSTGRN